MKQNVYNSCYKMYAKTKSRPKVHACTTLDLPNFLKSPSVRIFRLVLFCQPERLFVNFPIDILGNNIGDQSNGTHNAADKENKGRDVATSASCRVVQNCTHPAKSKAHSGYKSREWAYHLQSFLRHFFSPFRQPKAG